MKKYKYYNETDKGYIYDKRIFWVIMGVCLLLAFGIIASQNFSIKYNYYFKCEKDICINPLSQDFQAYNVVTQTDFKKDCTEDWCYKSTLPRGEYGKKSPLIIKLFPYIVLTLLILGMILNHLVHNKGKPFDIELDVSEKWKRKFKEIKFEEK